MREQPLPPDLHRRWGHLPDLVYRGNNEWSSSCAKCGGSDYSRREKSDRFRLFGPENGAGARGWCRQCHYFAFADDDQASPSREEITRATTERLRLTEQENKRIREKLNRIANSDFWLLWHSEMAPEHRILWHKQGIIDWAIDEYKLGYCQEHTTQYNGLEWTSPSMTIPHWGPAWELVNIQHRLLRPPDTGDKYRQMAGLPAAMFLTEPDEKLKGAVIIVEGAKKAIVTYTNLGMKSTGEPTLIVGVPGKTPSTIMLGKLQSCDPIYLMLDPDAYNPQRTRDGKIHLPAANRIATKLGKERVRIVKLPCKPDDLFTMYGGKAEDLKVFLDMAVRA